MDEAAGAEKPDKEGDEPEGRRAASVMRLGQWVHDLQQGGYEFSRRALNQLTLRREHCQNGGQVIAISKANFATLSADTGITLAVMSSRYLSALGLSLVLGVQV